VPPSRNTGRSFESASREASARGGSSRETRASPPFCGIGTGTISSANRPDSIAAIARRWLSNANRSWSSREIWGSSSRKFSAVSPMESFPYWALSRGFGNRHPNVVSHAVRFPIPPSRFFGTAYGARVMLSTPPATNTSPSPVLMARAAAVIAARPDEQRRLKVRPATETGKPARRDAIRATFRLSSPAWFAQPRYTSSTRAGSTPARRTTSPTTSAPRSSGRTSCPAWPPPTGRLSRNSRGGGPGSKASFRRLIPPLRGTFSPRLPGPLPPSFVVGNVYPPSSVRRRVRLQERPFGGFARGGLPVGCRQCTDGSKMVLFVTGICSFHCFYCPVSDEKMYKDVVFADEKRVTRDEDVLEEARAIRATGAGITGSDALDAVERTCRYIRLLKAESGPTF